MESTGVYWIALYELLESRGLEVLLANAKQLANVPGRKTDMSDCQWLQLLHSCGLLRGSFRPSEEVCQLRALMRECSNLIEVDVDLVVPRLEAPAAHPQAEARHQQIAFVGDPIGQLGDQGPAPEVLVDLLAAPLQQVEAARLQAELQRGLEALAAVAREVAEDPAVGARLGHPSSCPPNSWYPAYHPAVGVGVRARTGSHGLLGPHVPARPSRPALVVPSP